MPPTIRDMVQRMSRDELEQFCSQLHDASVDTVRWLLTDDNTLRLHYLHRLQTVIDLSPWLINEESEALNADTRLTETVTCPDCQNAMGEGTGHLPPQYWDDDCDWPEPLRCPTCQGKGYISERHAKRLKKQVAFIAAIGGQFADERPDKNGCFSDEFVTYAALVTMHLLLVGFNRGDALLMGFSAAMIDFGFTEEVES